MAPSSRVLGPVLAAAGVVAVVAVLAGLIAMPRNNAGPTPVPTLPPAPSAAPTAAGASVRVASIPDLLAALANDANTEIVVADGTYRVSAAGLQEPDSLWIGAAFAGRTRPVTVRAETIGGVTIDGAGAPYFGGISFNDGAHDQTWDGFVFANGTPTQTGVVTFGGHSGMQAAHHITLRNLRFLTASLAAPRTSWRRRPTTRSTSRRPRAARTTSCSRTSRLTVTAGSRRRSSSTAMTRSAPMPGTCGSDD